MNRRTKRQTANLLYGVAPVWAGIVIALALSGCSVTMRTAQDARPYDKPPFVDARDLNGKHTNPAFWVFGAF
jgi:hypothetical protein